MEEYLLTVNPFVNFWRWMRWQLGWWAFQVALAIVLGQV